MTLKRELLSIGPNAVGSGTIFNFNPEEPHKSTAIVTAYDDAGVSNLRTLVSRAQFVFAEAILGPNDITIPLRNVRARLMDNDQALYVAYYGRAGNRGRFVRRLSVRPSYRTGKSYYWPEIAPADIPPSYDVASGNNLIKARPIVIGQAHISWSDVIYQDNQPSLHTDLIGKINSNAYTIEGYNFPAGSLRFDGVSLDYDKYAAYDRWYVRYSATYDSALWYDGVLIDTESQENGAGPYGTPSAAPIFNEANYTTFPTMP